MVRERLWDKVCQSARGGGCIMIHDTNREQGFAIRSEGEARRGVEDFEGLSLIRIPQ